jgi:phenylpropionate dioxygenase-like ring-hydroxylating dioxygenase large terminal subunit
MTDLLDPEAARDEAKVLGQGTPSAHRYPFSMPFGWFMVAWSHELEPGAVLPRYLHGRHLVVWRDHDGTPHVQDAFCPHLGAHLGHGGRVRGTELECPFHGWRFDGDGRNTCIPYSERTNGKARVATYETFELGDHFVMAWFHPQGDPPKWQLELPPEATDPDFTEWTTVEFTVNAGQQELAENTVDGPHFRYVHNTETVPEIEDYDTDGWIARTKSVQRFPTPRGVVDGRIDIENQGPGFGFTWFRGIVDTLLIGCSTPIDEEHTRVCFNFKTRKLADERSTRSVGQAFINEVCKQFEEDRPIWQNKAHITRPALADTDPPFMRFRKWYAQFYADGVADDRTIWEPPPPVGGEQPVFVRPEATASRKNRADS